MDLYTITKLIKLSIRFYNLYNIFIYIFRIIDSILAKKLSKFGSQVLKNLIKI